MITIKIIIIIVIIIIMIIIPVEAAVTVVPVTIPPNKGLVTAVLNAIMSSLSKFQ